MEARRRLLEPMVLQILQAKWKYDEVDGARNCKFCSTPIKKTLWCSACRKTTYCSKECQTAHWPTHRIACKVVLKQLVKLKEMAAEDPGAIIFQERLSLFCDSAVEEARAAATSAYQALSSHPLHETHTAVVFISHNPAIDIFSMDEVYENGRRRC